MKIRIAIVDDKRLNRDTIREKISQFQEFELVLEAGNGQDFLGQMGKMKEAQFPQVVLMDLDMPVMGGVDAIKEGVRLFPSVKYIVLTIYEDIDHIFNAIEAGASGYLLKEDKAVNIIDAIANVVEYNGVPMSPAIARKAMSMLVKNPSVQEDLSKASDILSKREIEILRELASGSSYVVIGEKLFISPLTVRKHVANVYDKLHVNSRMQAVNLAQKNKWI
jgi:DNA-binding NarL/FixJ family response regulator